MQSGMTRASLAVIMLVLVITSLYSSIALAEYNVSVKLGLLAVDGATGNGIVVDAWLSVRSPGSGQVELEPSDLVEESTVLSTRVAFYLASIVNGLNPRLFDIHVLFETDSPVGGPSASGFIAAASLLALRGLIPDNTTTMTGMVSLTGFILPVAGVGDKVAAAKAAGYKRVLVPLSEANNTTEGIAVEGVCTFEEAASLLSDNYALGTKTSQLSQQPPGPIKSREAEFRQHAELFIEKASQLLDLLPRNETRYVIEMLLDKARNILDNSPYSAASMAFMAFYMAASSVAMEYGFNYLEKKTGLSLDAVLANASSIVEARLREFSGREICGLWGYEALAAASVRLYLAEHAADSDKPDVRVLALLRALSAESWARLADPDYGPMVSCSLLGRAAEFFVDYMQLSYNYIRSIVGHVLFNIPMPDDRDVSAWINDAKKSLVEGNYPLALGLAVYVISSLEESLSHGARLPASCIDSHVMFLEEVSVLGSSSSLPAALVLEYALGYGDYIENVTKNPLLRESLEIDAVTWLLHSLTVEALTADTLAGSQTVSVAWSNYYLLGITVEAVALAVIGYSLAVISRRARAEEV